MPLKGSVLVKLGLDDKEYNSKLKAATTKLNKSVRDMTREGRRLSVISRDIFVGLTLPMGILGKNIFDATANLEKMTLGLNTIAKSRGITAIDDLIEQTQRIAKLPGLGLEEAFKGVKQLIAVGASGQTALRVVEGLGIGIARAGGSAENFGRVMTQLTQALSKGTLQMQDFRTVFEQMPEARRVLENAFGPGMGDLEALRKSGKSVAEVVKTLAEGFHELGADGFMDTLANKTENLADSWLILRGAIGEEIFGNKFRSGLDQLAGLMDGLTRSIRALSPAQKQMIAEWSLIIAKLAVFLPSAAFVISRIKIMGALFLQYSKFVRGAAISTLFLGTSSTSAAAGLGGLTVALRSIGALGAAGMFARIGASVLAMSKWIIRAIPVVGELYIAFELLRNILPDFEGDLKRMGTVLVDLAIKHFPALASAIATVAGWFSKGEQAGSRLDAMSRRAAGSGLDFAKSWKKPIDDFITGMDTGKEKVSALDKAVKNLSDTLKTRMRVRAGLAGADPFPNVSSRDLAQRLFNDDPQNTFGAAATIPTLDIAKITASNMELTKMKEIIAGIGDVMSDNEGFAAFKQLMVEQIGGGVLTEGIEGMSNAFGAFFDTVLSGGEDAFKSFGQAMGQAVKDMLVHLVKLIAKLAIAAALVQIVFPGAGGLKSLMAGKGIFGGENAKGGFLKNLFGGLFGFADGGVVGGNSPVGDRILARVNSGELILNKGQQAAVSAAMSGSNVRLTGEFKIRGRDLVYIVEDNQRRLNGVR